MAVLDQNYIFTDDLYYLNRCNEVLIVLFAEAEGFLPAQLPFVISCGKLARVAQEIGVLIWSV